MFGKVKLISDMDPRAQRHMHKEWKLAKRTSREKNNQVPCDSNSITPEGVLRDLREFTVY